MTYGATIRHTALAVHGTGAVITTHGTAAAGIGTDGHTVHTTIADFMTLGIMAEYTTHGTMADGMAMDT